MSGLFIAGTDTSVGKTLVTAGLAGFLRQQNIDCGVMKPVESGVVEGSKESDSYFLKEVSGVADDLDLINVYAFADPLAPGVAAEKEGVTIDFENIAQAFGRLSLLHRHVLVEGAGGLLVPLAADKTVVDLIKSLQLPVLLVGRLGLGTLNHTLLSLEYLQQQQVPVAGVVLSATEAAGDLSTHTNPQILEQWTDVPLWGVIKHLPQAKNKEQVIAAVGEAIGSKSRKYFTG